MDVCFKNLKMKAMKGMYCFLLLLIINISNVSRLTMGNENLEVKNYLTGINKTPVKSITSPDGDIIDCIRILDQPTFDHPLLKEDTIQMRPHGLAFDDGQVSEGRSYGFQTTKDEDERPINQLWSESCPEGTIPRLRGSFVEEDYNSIPNLSTHGVSSS